MPKASCPACQSDVTFSKGAEPGSAVTCPECDEVFTPPQLKKKPKYRVEDEETYKVHRAETKDQDEMDKTRYAGAAMRGARAKERVRKELAREGRYFWFDGPEIWLVIFAVGVGGGVPFGFWLARSWSTLGDKKVFLILAVMVAALVAAFGLGGSAWAWLRKSR